MEVDVCCVAETFSDHLETEEGGGCYSRGDDVGSICVGPGS